MQTSSQSDIKQLTAATAATTAGKWYAYWNELLGLAQFDKAIPLIISSIAIGVSIVTRTFIKSLGHLIGAIIVTLVFALWMNRAVTAFLCYSIGYVFMCMKNGRPDAFTLIGICIGFSLLFLIDLIVSMATGGSTPYLITAILSVACGIGGVFITQSLGGKAALYDFKGCSCDDCANANQCQKNGKAGQRALAVIKTA